MAKAKKKEAKKIAKKNVNDWPNKKNILFRPERMKYVRKILNTKGCVFCSSAQAEMSEETLCVYKTDHTQIVLNKYPYNSGHLLVLPIAHVDDLLKLSPERYDDLNRSLRVAIQAIETLYQPSGYNVGLNKGSSAGAGIPDHLHYHIIPRWSGDLNFFPLIAETKVVIESLEDSYKKLSDYFNNFKKAERSL